MQPQPPPPYYPPPGIPSPDDENLRLLTLFHYIYAGLQLAASIFGLSFVGFGTILTFSPEMQKNAEVPPALVGSAFVIIGVIIIAVIVAFAFLTYYAGKSIKQRTRHTFCIVVACLNCLSMPLGTALGIFTIVILTKPSVKLLFRPA